MNSFLKVTNLLALFTGSMYVEPCISYNRLNEMTSWLLIGRCISIDYAQILSPPGILGLLALPASSQFFEQHLSTQSEPVPQYELLLQHPPSSGGASPPKILFICALLRALPNP
jgi:hypothetical protein